MTRMRRATGAAAVGRLALGGSDSPAPQDNDHKHMSMGHFSQEEVYHR